MKDFTKCIISISIVIAITILLIAIPTFTQPPKTEIPQQRVMTGNYYDYLVVETIDGNEYLLDDVPDSPYLENSYPIFEDGELVQVLFDTQGTEDIQDDVILQIRSIANKR